MKKFVFCAGVCLLFAFVLFFPRESFAGARAGLMLWSGTLVPTLLPAMMLSRLLLSTNLAYQLARCLSRPFHALLGIGPYGVYALLVGFLCGCPMGAKVLSDLRQNGQISQEEARYLGLFCNNISPAFLANYLVLQNLKSESLLAPTLSILLGAPVLYGFFTNPKFRRARGVFAANPPKNKAPATAAAVVDACISDSILGITKLGGYVILFSVVSAMISRFAAQYALAKTMLLCLAEISGGIACAAGLSLPFAPKYLLLVAAAAFGGLCCAAQSAQMLDAAGIPMKNYLRARLCITAIAVLLAACYIA